jgi:large subunit ribosomal protein L4
VEEPAQRSVSASTDVGQLNTYDVLVSDDVVFTQDALSEFVAARTDGAELAITEQKPAKKAEAKKAPP